MTVRPLHDRLMVQRLDEGEQKIGGIIIPDSAKEKPQQGTVIAAGRGKTTDTGKRVPLDINAGDRILFGKFSGHEVTLDGEPYLIMKEADVLAVIDGPATQKADRHHRQDQEQDDHQEIGGHHVKRHVDEKGTAKTKEEAMIGSTDSVMSHSSAERRVDSRSVTPHGSSS